MYAPPPEYDDRPIEEKPAAGISNQVNLSPTLSSRPSAPPLPPRPVPPAAPVDLAPEMMENLAVIRETLYSGKISILVGDVLAGSDTFGLQPSPKLCSPRQRCANCLDGDRAGHHESTLLRRVSQFWK